MTAVENNLNANVIGRTYIMASSLLLAPAKTNIFGIEAYGFIGFYIILIAVLFIVDFGITVSICREAAVKPIDSKVLDSLRDITFTLKLINKIIGKLLCVAAIIFSDIISKDWLGTADIPLLVTKRAVVLMGISLALQWPTAFYAGGLSGLQRQVDLNVINVIVANSRGFGAWEVLIFAFPSLFAFFQWQIFANLAAVLTLRFFLWKRQPGGAARPRFSAEALRPPLALRSGFHEHVGRQHHTLAG